MGSWDGYWDLDMAMHPTDVFPKRLNHTPLPGLDLASTIPASPNRRRQISFKTMEVVVASLG